MASFHYRFFFHSEYYAFKLLVCVYRDLNVLRIESYENRQFVNVCFQVSDLSMSHWSVLGIRQLERSLSVLSFNMFFH